MADAQARGKSYCCLICHVSFSTEIKEGKVNALFLLKILLEIPKDSELIKSSDFVQVCEQCGNVIKKCKLIYRKICDEIERFWECQNKILEGFSKSTTKDDDDRDTVSEKNQWANHCRNFVKNHDFTGFGFPFVVQDLESLVIFSPTKTFNQVNCTVKNELCVITAEEDNEDVSSPIPILEDPPPTSSSPHSSERIRNFTSTSTTDQDEIRLKEELESELGDNYTADANDMSEYSDDDDNNDSEYEASPSKKPKTIRNCNLRKSSPRKCKPDKKISDGGDGTKRRSLRNRPSPNSALCQVPPPVERAPDEDNFERDLKTKKFHCTWPECTKQFVERKSIIWHMDKHRGTPRRECDECDLKFFSMPQLRRHQELEHGNGAKFKCKTCGEDFPCRAKLNQHWSAKHSTNTTFNKPVICEICGKSVRLSNLEQHVKRLHSSGGIQKRFCCHLCPNIFEKEVRLKMHLWRVHQICESEEVKEMLLKINEKRRELGTKGTRWKCRVKGCVLWFATQEGWRSHVDNRHGGKEGDGEEGRFKCEICGKGFHKNNVFKAHLEAHDRQMGKRERNWICVICGWSHETERKLNGHMDKVHKGEELKPRPFKCDLCTKRFGTKVHLNYHKRHIHKLTKE